MLKLIILGSLVLLIVSVIINMPTVLAIKKGWGYRGMKKLQKSEVEVKTYLFPCSIDEERFLNSTFGTNYKHLHNCKKKLVIRMTVNSGGEYCSKSDGFIPIDHVIDGISGRKKRLLNPLMIRLKREKMFQLYDLQLVKSVNAEATEEVINYENTGNFTGCDTSSSHPTCGFSFFNNKIVQFSEGFCCSCDQAKNDQRQPCESHPGDGKNMPDVSRYAIRHHRSNRSSRDLETVEPRSELFGGNPVEHTVIEKENEKSPLFVSTEDQQLLGEDLNKDKNIENRLGSRIFMKENGLSVKKRTNNFPLESNSCFGNVTIRTFQFEHTQAPKDVDSKKYTMTNINILIKSIENNNNVDKCTENINKLEKSTENINNLDKSTTDPNNPLSHEKLKLLMMNKIKQNKNDEKISTTDCSLQRDSTKSPNKIRSVNIKPKYNVSDKIKESPEVDQKQFYMKLASGNSELDIQIVTKKPKDHDLYEPIVNVPFTAEDLKKESISLAVDNSTKNSKLSLRDFMKRLKLQQLNGDESNLSTSDESSKSKKNNTDSLKSMEKIVYKLVPLINSAPSSTEHKNSEMKNVLLKDQENTNHSMFIELKKKPGYEIPSSIQNNSVTFSLQNEIVLNSSLQLHDLKSLNPDSSLEVEMENYQNKEVLGFAPTLSPLNHHQQNIEKREASSRQIRGGQSCCQDGKSLPCNANPETYFESAHCLRFSDLWYSVHRLVNPRMENSISVQIYAKHKSCGKKTCWENLTNHVPGRVGTSKAVLTDDGRTVVISYSSDDKVAFSIDCASDYLLVPQPVPKRCKDSELKTLACGGPGEYLLLKENEITFSGEECDRAGVSYAAFARQPHRCQRQAQACLRNQPLQFWRDDKKAVAEGKQGQYFLSNFITVTDQAILQNISSNLVVLRAPYFERYQSHVVVELNADHIDIIGDRSEGQITEVYIDATSDKVTIVKAVVTNLGIAADLFGVDFANCSSPLGPSDFDKPGKDEIPPQHRITYTATISTPLLHKHTECQLALYNVDQELIASRRIVIEKGQRCMCVWHCQCVCYNYPYPGLLCTPLSLKDYNRAGFPGHLPVISGSDCSTIFIVLQSLLWLFLFLLLLGLIKAVLGLCFSYIAVWGLWYLLPDEARSLYCYMEPHLACYPIVHDCEGFPIHPQTYRRTVRFLPWYSEFSVNVFFFICVARTCLCERLSRRASSIMFAHQQYQPVGCGGQKVGRGCSPGCSTRRAGNSPCGSVCSNRRKFRLAAGGETQFPDPGPQALADQQLAKRLVDELTNSYIVFRNLSRPIGGVHCVPGAPYCVRGFFQESDNGVYTFSPPSPLLQVWQMDHSPLIPPVLLDPTPFRAIYRSASEVLASRELSPQPRGIVINEQ